MGSWECVLIDKCWTAVYVLIQILVLSTAVMVNLV